MSFLPARRGGGAIGEACTGPASGAPVQGSCAADRVCLVTLGQLREMPGGYELARAVAVVEPGHVQAMRDRIHRERGQHVGRAVVGLVVDLAATEAGAVAAYAPCPLDPGQPCAANQPVSDAPFTLVSGRDWRIWHGDYSGLVFADGTLWATWSDNRTGGAAMYVARGQPR